MTSSRAGGEKTDTMAEERGRRKPAIDERRPLPPEPDRAPDPWNDGPWNEIASLLLFAAGMVLLLSLISYSSADPSINALRSETRIRNLMGPFGANLSDLLYQLFGLTSLFLPLALFAAGWIQWRESQSQLTKGHLLGLLLMFVAMTGILTFMEQLNEVNVDGIEPMTSVTPMRLKRRKDAVTDGSIQSQVLKNAPDAREGFFAVPKVVE